MAVPISVSKWSTSTTLRILADVDFECEWQMAIVLPYSLRRARPYEGFMSNLSPAFYILCLLAATVP